MEGFEPETFATSSFPAVRKLVGWSVDGPVFED